MRVYTAALLIGVAVSFIAADPHGAPWWVVSIVNGLACTLIWGALSLIVREARGQ